MGSGNWTVTLCPRAVDRPVGAGGNHDLVGAVFQNIVGRHFPHTEMGFDVLQLIQLDLPVSNNEYELGATRVTGYVSPMLAEFGHSLAQLNVVALFAYIY